MIFRTASVAIFLASVSCVAAQDEVRKTCYDNYDEIFPLELGTDECSGIKVRNEVIAKFKSNRAEKKVKCPGGHNHEFSVLTGQLDVKQGLDYIDDLCANALMEASESYDTIGWETVTNANVDLKKYFAGQGFLNSETGNFQQDPAKFKNNRDSYIYMGDNPTLNDHYPTSEASYNAGIAIGEMAEEKVQNFFSQPDGVKETCTSNTAMCCWHRDRQYFDDNGNCNPKDCANQNPGDNTDLCWTELNGAVWPYPGSKTENSIHCHGLSWSNDMSGLDINTKARWNTLFYVAMEDHLRTRGYVESLEQDPKLQVEQAMCGCLEDMAPVARADCSEAVGVADYKVTLDSGVIQVEATNFELEFQACEGFLFTPGVTPEKYDEANNKRKELGLKGKNNDLSAHVFKQYLEAKIGEDKVEIVEETLVGYRHPKLVNKNDIGRNEVCEAAFKAKFEDMPYEEKEATI